MAFGVLRPVKKGAGREVEYDIRAIALGFLLRRQDAV